MNLNTTRRNALEGVAQGASRRSPTIASKPPPANPCARPLFQPVKREGRIMQTKCLAIAAALLTATSLGASAETLRWARAGCRSRR